jgi:hypothetical protein
MAASLEERLRGLFVHDPGRFRSFAVDGTVFGAVETRFAAVLSRLDDVFEVGADRVALRGALREPAARTEAALRVARALQEEGWVPRHEPEAYPVVLEFGDEPAFLVDRAFVPFLGVRCFGVHLNGYVERADGLHLWVGRRTTRRAKSPGKLDHLVAGGQAAGLGLMENVVKEAAEEAAVPESLARRAVSVGRFRYRQDQPHGVRDDTLHLYDLALPESFRPENHDGEIDEFFLWSADRVLRSLRTEPEAWKYNVAPIVLDFLVRRGVAPPDDPAYAVLRAALQR